MSQDQENEAMESSGMSPVTKVAMPLEVELARIKEGLWRLYDPLLKKGVLEGNYTPYRLLRILEQVMGFLESSLEEDQARSEGSPRGSPSSARDESGKG
jgi:hypothetical protein